ncbi:hypothetical protein DB346_16075 [Verrucomicrobia bacterium LW23]|nr:hypothetical protein DB346_16075 [Verrucomicrobia bacterium LW23]
MAAEAEEELRQVEPERAGDLDVLSVWQSLWCVTRRWPEAAEVARRLCDMEPNNGDWPIQLAYATRRASSIEEAERILRDARERFPRESTIVYNLACYACQQDRLDEARTLLRTAFEMNASHYRLAQTDPDLAPLRAELDILLSGGGLA